MDKILKIVVNTVLVIIVGTVKLLLIIPGKWLMELVDLLLSVVT